jgi:glutamine synthetase adenylyltransferase
MVKLYESSQTGMVYRINERLRPKSINECLVVSHRYAFSPGSILFFQIFI